MYLLKKFLLNENKDQIMLLKTKSKSQNQVQYDSIYND